MNPTISYLLLFTHAVAQSMFSVQKTHIHLVSLEFLFFLDWIFTSPLPGISPHILHQLLSTEYLYTCPAPLSPFILYLSLPLPIAVILWAVDLGGCKFGVEYGNNSCLDIFDPL